MTSNTKYIYKGNKKLRTGYTTGSCGAAATKAALTMLIDQKSVDQVSIVTPKTWTLNLSVDNQVIEEDYASCSITKDSGDDPDITNGALIYSKVSYRDDGKINIYGGQGVGKVTKKGLRVEVGKSAINPTPYSMIEKEAKLLNTENKGFNIEISIPNGEELAKKTFNPKLGIVGGLSILGTSGIVEPMSEDALMKSIEQEINVAHAENNKIIILTPGNIGEKKLKDIYGDIDIPLIKISNYLGYALEVCGRLKYENILISGHIGKLVKVAGGAFYTHNRTTKTRLEILVTYLALARAPYDLLDEIIDVTTTDEAVKLINGANLQCVYATLADKLVENCQEYIFDQCNIETAIFDMNRLLVKSEKFEEKLRGE